MSCRFAKRRLDDTTFYGGALHICFAPEFESVAETRGKLQERRRVIAARVRKLGASRSEANTGIELRGTFRATKHKPRQFVFKTSSFVFVSFLPFERGRVYV